MMPERWEVLKEHLQHCLHFDSSFFFTKAHVENVAPRRFFFFKYHCQLCNYQAFVRLLSFMMTSYSCTVYIHM